MALKYISDTMGLNGFFPALLVFGSLPSLSFTAVDRPFQLERLAALRTAREEISTLVAAQRISAASSRLPPATHYQVSPVDHMPVYRERIKQWEGPSLVNRISGKQVWVTDSNGRIQQFNIAQVLPEPAVGDDRVLRLHHECLCEGNTEAANTTRWNTQSVNLTETLHPADPRGVSPLFNIAKKEELYGLVDRASFEVVSKASVPPGRASYPEDLCSQSRMRIPNRPCAKRFLIHNSSMARPASVQLLVTIAVMLRYALWSFDAMQAYLQSAVMLTRVVYVRSPLDISNPDTHLLRLKKALYCLSDSGDYWHDTLSRVLKKRCGIRVATGDPALYFRGAVEGRASSAHL